MSTKDNLVVRSSSTSICQRLLRQSSDQSDYILRIEKHIDEVLDWVDLKLGNSSVSGPEPQNLSTQVVYPLLLEPLSTISFLNQRLGHLLQLTETNAIMLPNTLSACSYSQRSQILSWQLPWFKFPTEIRVKILEICMKQIGYVKPFANKNRRDIFNIGSFLLVNHRFSREAIQTFLSCNTFSFSSLRVFNEFLSLLKRSSLIEDGLEWIKRIRFDINLMYDDCLSVRQPLGISNDYKLYSEWLQRVRETRFLLAPLYYTRLYPLRDKKIQDLSASYRSLFASQRLHTIEVEVDAFYGLDEYNKACFFWVHPLSNTTIPSCTRKILLDRNDTISIRSDDLTVWHVDEGIHIQFLLKKAASDEVLFQEKRELGLEAKDLIDWLIQQD